MQTVAWEDSLEVEMVVVDLVKVVVEEVSLDFLRTLLLSVTQ